MIVKGELSDGQGCQANSNCTQKSVRLNSRGNTATCGRSDCQSDNNTSERER